MPLRFGSGEVALTDSCGAEDALELADWLAKEHQPKADLRACSHLHAAVLQTLLAYKPVLSAPPVDPFLLRWVVPALANHGDSE